MKLDELVPGELPAWEKDLRPPTAKGGGWGVRRGLGYGFVARCEVFRGS